MVSTSHRIKHGLATALALVVSGCGGAPIGNFDQPSGGSKILSYLVGFGKSGQSGQAATQPEARTIDCPEIFVLEGTAAAQFYAGSPPSNATLRHQYAIGDVARECKLEGDQILIKVGIAGKVLLGPAGSPASFSVPVRIAIVRESDNQPIVSKLYKAGATISRGETQAEFTVISEPLQVPFIQDHANLDYTIKVGIDTAGTPEKAPGSLKKPESARHRSG